MNIHHVGYLVKKLDLARRQFRQLGYSETGKTVYDACRDAEIVFLKKDGYCIELVCPRSKDSVVSDLLKRYRNTPYHICYETDDLEKELVRLEAGGFTRIDAPCPAPAVGGRRVCFLMGAGIGMIEILEGKRKTSS